MNRSPQSPPTRAAGAWPSFRAFRRASIGLAHSSFSDESDDLERTGLGPDFQSHRLKREVNAAATPPPKHRGHPRADYAREYWVVNSRASESQFLSVVSKAFDGRKTGGFSYDDAGIGDLSSRRIVAWGSEFPQQTLIDWYDWYYRGATVTFQPGY